MKHFSLVKNRTRILIVTAILSLLLSIRTTAQVKVGDNPNTIKNASLLELESTNKGLALPRVSLTGTLTSPAPLASDILQGTVVYNTNAAFIGGIGLFVWTATGWMAVTPTSLSSIDAWKLTGNVGTNPSLNFIGTADAQPLIFKTNGQKSGRIDYLNTTANTSFGFQSLNTNISGINNTVIGYAALGTNSTGNNNTAAGYAALASNTIGSNNVANGNGALISNTTGSNNTSYGSQALYSNSTGTNNTALGSGANVTSANLSNTTIIGANARVNINNALVLGDSINNVLVGIGTGSPTANLHVKGTVRFAGLPNGVLITDGIGNLSTTTVAAIDSASWNIVGNGGTDSATNFLGTTDAQPLIIKVNNQKAGRIDYSASQNTAFGYKALNVNTIGSSNVASGVLALSLNTTGSNNSAFGYRSLSNNISGNNNAAYGDSALLANTAGNNNTAYGLSSLDSNTTGSYNVAYGDSTLQRNTNGNYNTAIGHHANVTSTNLINATAIGANAKVSISNAVVLGNNANVGIGTSSPLAGLQVANTDVLFSAPGDIPTEGISDVPISGAGRRTMWYPGKAAFRTGYVNGTQWDENNIGIYSFASGNNTTAYGRASIAMGINSFASNDYSIALGNGATAGANSFTGRSAVAIGTEAHAQGDNAVAIGTSINQSAVLNSNSVGIGYNVTTASNSVAIGPGAYAGISAMAIGEGNVASGTGSSALGANVKAEAFAETVVGAFNVQRTVSATTWVPTDPVFVVGNGYSVSPRSDALTVLKNGNTGIGAINPTATLHVSGTVRFDSLRNGILTTDALGNLSTSSLSGFTNNWGLTGNSGTSSSTNFIGTTDGQPLVFKVNNQKAGWIDYNSSPANTSWGFQSLNAITSGSLNTATGYKSLYSTTSGNGNTGNGYFSLYNNTTGAFNTANGFNSLYSNTAGNNNTATGIALYSNSSGNDNDGYGLRSLNLNTTGSLNVAYGDSTLLTNTTGNFNTAIGHYADVTNNNLSNATAIGYKARVNISNALVLGDSTDNVKVGIGTGSPTANLHVKGSVRFAGLTNGIVTADANGNLSTTSFAANNWSLTGNSGTNPSTNFIGTTDAQPLFFRVNGVKAGWIDVAGASNTSFGYNTLVANTSGVQNVAIGSNAFTNNTSGNYNTATGIAALFLNTTANCNTANGALALRNNIGSFNTASGYRTLYQNTSGTYNTANGLSVLINNTTGNYNTAVGSGALISNISGSNNTGIGSNTDVSDNLINATAIGANAKVNISNALVLGDSTDNVKVGIGTGSPTANLHVKGSVRFAGLTNGVLTADANGNLSATSLSANSWSLTGNNGTNPSINFIGTTNAQPLVFKVNNQISGKLDNILFNTSFGYQSLNSVSTGRFNTANGYQSLVVNNADGNTANGYQSLNSNTTGTNNTALGTVSLKTNTTGNYNTAIGYSADVNSNNLTNATAIGYNAKAAISNSVILGNTTDGVKVGIGTSSPTQRLEVNGGSIYANGESTGFISDNGTNARVGLIKYSGRVSGIWRTSSTPFEVGRVDASVISLPGSPSSFTTDFYIDGAGNIGMGTTSPGTNAKVEINGGINHAVSSYRYMNSGGEGNAGNPGASYSLYTSNRIWCGEEINVTSDARTKTNILTSSPLSNLSLINNLRVVNYNYKDKVSKGTANITGFLAQEVEQVMPDAVTKNTGVVPDIYQNAVNVKYDSINRTLTLLLKETADIRAGDTVKLITDAGEQFSNVASVNGNSITVSNWLQNSKWVFVYGKQVNDLRNLDYNKIFSAGIGAIQELSKENEALKSDVETLKTQMKLLMERTNTTIQAVAGKPKSLYQ